MTCSTGAIGPAARRTAAERRGAVGPRRRSTRDCSSSPLLGVNSSRKCGSRRATGRGRRAAAVAVLGRHARASGARPSAGRAPSHTPAPPSGGARRRVRRLTHTWSMRRPTQSVNRLTLYAAADDLVEVVVERGRSGSSRQTSCRTSNVGTTSSVERGDDAEAPSASTAPANPPSSAVDASPARRRAVTSSTARDGRREAPVAVARSRACRSRWPGHRDVRQRAEVVPVRSPRRAARATSSPYRRPADDGAAGLRVDLDAPGQPSDGDQFTGGVGDAMNECRCPAPAARRLPATTREARRGTGLEQFPGRVRQVAGPRA